MAQQHPRRWTIAGVGMGVVIVVAIIMVVNRPRDTPDGRPRIAASPISTTTSGILRHDGRDRSYLVHLPSGPPTGRPLVIALHGGGSTGTDMRALTHLTTVASRHGFLVVFPDGVGRSWNDGNVPPTLQAESRGVDDVSFLLALIDRMIADYRIDPARVYATGISNGGSMALRLGCEHPDRIAAVAPVASALFSGQADGCRPAQAMPMMLIHGTADPSSPYDGGTIRTPDGTEIGTSMSSAATVRHFAAVNGCADERVHLLPNSSDDGTVTAVHTWTDCPDAAAAVLYEVRGGGHTWPGGEQYLPAAAIGATSHDFNASEVIWSFFAEHRRA
jgi:polyhydroxybutyrate depolymerase